jgi:hypothetical protein
VLAPNDLVAAEEPVLAGWLLAENAIAIIANMFGLHRPPRVRPLALERDKNYHRHFASFRDTSVGGLFHCSIFKISLSFEHLLQLSKPFGNPARLVQTAAGARACGLNSTSRYISHDGSRVAELPLSKTLAPRKPNGSNG